MNSKKKILDPPLLAELAKLSLSTQSRVSGNFSGEHKSLQHGEALEFSDHRPYAQGDEPRSVDWKIYGRTDRLFVKRYEMQASLKLYLVLDTSLSMNYPQDQSRSTKWDYSLSLAMAIAFVILRQGDSVGILTVHKKKLSVVPARSSMSQLEILEETLLNLAPDSSQSFAEMIVQTSQGLKERAHLVFLSDFLEEDEPLFKILQLLKRQKHVLYALHILDHYETELPFYGRTRLISNESGEKIDFNLDRVRTTYRKSVEQWIDNWRRVFHRMSGRYELAITQDSQARILRRLFGQGSS